MKNILSKMLSIMLCLSLIVPSSSLTYAIMTEENKLSETTYLEYMRPYVYNGYDLEWNNNNQLVGLKNSNLVTTYSYNSQSNRECKKVNDSAIEFTYKDGLLVGENREDCFLSFEYKESVAGDHIIKGFYLNQSLYEYIIVDNIIVGIYDESGNIICKYEYGETGQALSVLGMNGSNNWVDMGFDKTFIGNINPIRYNGLYYDIETGWYYNGRYFDPVENRFINGHDMSLDDLKSDILQGDLSYSGSTTLSSPNDINAKINAINTWSEFLLSSSTYGRPITASGAWYSSLSDVELIARLIYGENTKFKNEQKAIS